MIVKEKIKLDSTPYGYYSLKRWDTDDGFYIEYTPLGEYETLTIFSRGSSIIECIENLSDECPCDKKILFDGMTDYIIEEFKLTDEEITYMISLGEWCDF